MIREDSLFLAWGGGDILRGGGGKIFNASRRGGEKFSTRREGGAKNFQRDLFFSTHQNSMFSSVYMGFGVFSIFRSKGGRKFFNGPRRGGEKFSTRPEGGAKNFQSSIFRNPWVK